MENGLFWLRSWAEALHYCNHWSQYSSPPLSPGQAAGNLGISCQSLIREGLSPTELELIRHVLVSVPRLIFMPDFISKSFFICVLLGVPYSPSGIVSWGLQKVSHHFSSSSLSVHSNPSLKLTSSRKFILLHCHYNLSCFLLYHFSCVLFSVFLSDFLCLFRLFLTLYIFWYMLWNIVHKIKKDNILPL